MNLETIPPIYWMIVIGAISFMICFVLYYVAMLLKETKEAVTDSRGIIQQAEKSIQQLELIVNDLQSSISTVRTTVEEVNQMVLVPLRKLGAAIGVVSSFLNKEEKKEEK